MGAGLVLMALLGAIGCGDETGDAAAAGDGGRDAEGQPTAYEAVDGAAGEG